MVAILLTISNAFFQLSSDHFQLTQCRVQFIQATKYLHIHRRRATVSTLNKQIDMEFLLNNMENDWLIASVVSDKK